MAVTVAMLERTYRAGEHFFAETATPGFGWPMSPQQSWHGDHFQSATRADNLASPSNWGVQHFHRSQRAEGEDWQRQRHALDATIGDLLQKLMPGSAASAPGLSLSQQHFKQSSLGNVHMAVAPPPGLEPPAMQVQNDVQPVDDTLLTFPTLRAPPGLCNKHEAVKHQNDAWDVLEDAPFVEKEDVAKSTSTDSNSDGCPEREGRRTLLIAYFPRGTSEDNLQSVFEAFGNVHTVNIVKDKVGLPMCYGFIRFAKASAAEEAFSTCQTGRIIMHDSTGKAWHLKASWARNAYGKGKNGKRARARATALADV
mmetsp:Transcript_159972/g.298478  ORF Transcript_159972/g.298478 Transcript_159972/m.298478 type:complete len:311 (+) Transcript_159972:67-999(+)